MFPRTFFKQIGLVGRQTFSFLFYFYLGYTLQKSTDFNRACPKIPMQTLRVCNKNRVGIITDTFSNSENVILEILYVTIFIFNFVLYFIVVSNFKIQCKCCICFTSQINLHMCINVPHFCQNCVSKDQRKNYSFNTYCL